MRPQRRARIAAATLLAGALWLPGAAAAPGGRPLIWAGTWTWDLCHEDRKPDHAPESFCRQGLDRIIVSDEGGGRVDLKLCPADPWNEKGTQLQDGGRRLSFRSREGYEIRLRLGEDRSHFTGRFISRDGHFGWIRGRRVNGC